MNPGAHLAATVVQEQIGELSIITPLIFREHYQTLNMALHVQVIPQVSTNMASVIVMPLSAASNSHYTARFLVRFLLNPAVAVFRAIHFLCQCTPLCVRLIYAGPLLVDSEIPANCNTISEEPQSFLKNVDVL